MINYYYLHRLISVRDIPMKSVNAIFTGACITHTCCICS